MYLLPSKGRALGKDYLKTKKVSGKYALTALKNKGRGMEKM